MSMTLTCKDCGKDFIKPGNKGTVPSRCPDCRLEAKREAARRHNEKRRELRERVREKQTGVAPKRILQNRTTGLHTCRRCRERKPKEQFWVDGIRKNLCQECRARPRTRGWGLTKCTTCDQVFPTDTYPMARGGRRHRRICANCVAEAEQLKEQKRREEAEAEAFIAGLMAKGKNELTLEEREARMDESIRQAKEQNMSYGQYKAMLLRREQERHGC